MFAINLFQNHCSLSLYNRGACTVTNSKNCAETFYMLILLLAKSEHKILILLKTKPNLSSSVSLF